jgi:hypothetical protein
MRHSNSLRIWISAVALTIFVLTASAPLFAQTTSGTDIQFHKFVPLVPPENSKFAAANASDPAQVNSVISQQIQLLMQEKASRTPAQQKIDSNVLYTIRMMRGQQAAPGVTSLYTGVDLDQNNRIVVDIVANVTADLLQQLESAGALVLSSYKDYRAIRALVPPDQIEIIAASPDVTFIGRKIESFVSRVKLPAVAKGAFTSGFEERAARVRKQLATYLLQQQHAGTNSTSGTPNTGSGSVDTEGDAAHQAARARGLYGVTGAGLKIGVLSDSANNTGAVTVAQATGDLPPTCPGTGGSCLTIVQDDTSGGTDEGAAMLEIVHDMAPGATLFFATADISEAGFATNILNLRNTSHCDIIVDDVGYFDESPFQDGVVAQAVTTVTAAGAMYFSSAGNEGSVAAGTSGYFEGDFNDTGSAAFTFPGGTKTGTIHNFGSAGSPINGDIITATGEAYTMSWADPAGASLNDYDLFLVSSTGTIKAQSTNIQSGTQNPFEQITPPALVAGDRLVVFKTTAAAVLAFSINTLRGTLTQVTTGQTHGHSAVAAAFSVAATPAAAAFNGVAPVGPFPGAFTTTDSTEPFSSDGPRRQFFNANGTAITPGNFLFGTNGGAVINKPDVTAADGVSTTLPSSSGLNPFYGTSAAAPHAASIAALIMAAKPSLTPAQIRTTLTTTALDIDAAGYDTVSGNGIVMALAALNSLGISPGADPEISSVTASENPGNGNGIIEAGEGASLVIQLTNQFGVANATGITATLTTITPGVTITLPGTSSYADIATGATGGSNLSPFTFTLANNAACGLNIDFILTVTFNGGSGSTTRTLNFTVQTGLITISNNLGGATPIGMPAGMTFLTGTQTGRLFRSDTASVCGTNKANPGLTTTTGSRTFDAYTLTPNTSACLNVTLTSVNGAALFHAAYNSGGFVPATPSTDYLADPGNSLPSISYGVSANAGTGITFVVHDLNAGASSNSPYTLTFPSCTVTPAGSVNHPPTAVAQNVTVTAATVGGTAAANINNGSSDPDVGDTITLTQTPPGPYPVGVTSVILTVTDSKGAKAQATANVTVLDPPTISSLSPTTVTAGSGAFTLIVNGANFVTGDVVNFNGAAKTTTFVNVGQLTAAILAADVATAGTPSVTVSSPAPGSVTSAGTTFTISGASNPVPTITSIAPTNTLAGSAAFTLTVTGTNFVSGATVNFNGTARATSFQNSTQVSATILSTDVTTAGTFPVTVTNPTPGGGTSTAVNFTVNNPVPVVSSLSPSSVAAGSGGFTLTVNGTGFVASSAVNVNGGARVTTFVSSTQLTATLTAGDDATVSTPAITVTSLTPGGGTSNSVNLNVTAASNPAPTITSLVPNSATAGGAQFTLIVNGTNLISTSVVNFNGSPRATTFVSGGQVTATITAADIATAGSASITVTNPTPGGGTSPATTFAINNPFPTVTSVSPTTGLAGGPAFNLTVNGTGFVSNSVVNFNHVARVTTFVSSTQLTAAILASDIAAAGSLLVTVTDPTPGGGTSTNNVTFQVNNPVPVISSLSPTSIAAGSTAFTLTINGTNFITGAQVNFGGVNKGTTFVSSTQVTVSILPSDVATAGTPAVTLSNPTPGGGASNTVNFNVTAAANPVPTITSISPTSIAAGSIAFTLTVNGTNFVSNSVVSFNGAPKLTTFVSATQLTAQLQSLDVETAGNAPVVVNNPTPGGGQSNSVTFTITPGTNPVPTVTSLSPTGVVAGSGAFTLTVNGTNFVSGAIVNFGGANKITTFVNSTQVTAAILATDVATAATRAVLVNNPNPGGGPSNSVNFNVTAAANPVPTITSLSPTNTSAGSGAFTLTVNGTNFVATSSVQWNGSPRTTTFVSATQLTAAITAADIQTANLYLVSVFNPTPGGGTSNVVTFTATTPIPAIGSLAPNSAIAGGAAFNMTVTGSNFINTSVVQWKGGNRTTTFVSSTQLMAAITAADIATAGTASVQVFTPTVVFSGTQGLPSGVTSNALTFTITAPNPVPTLTAISPTSIGAGGAGFTMTLTGTNFVSSSVAQVKGSARTTTFVSATQLTAAITAADIATPSTAAITVFTPTPGGGTTSAINLTITDFSVTPTPATQTIPAGNSTTYTINTATVGGAFAGNVTFTASGFPTGAAGTFNPTSVAPGASTVLTVTTTARGLAQTPRVPNNPGAPNRPLWLIAFALTLALVSLAIAKLGKRSARRLIPIGAFAVLLISAAYLSGCAGSGFPKVGVNGTPAGTYPITVTGTSGTDVHSTTVTLVVQ